MDAAVSLLRPPPDDSVAPASQLRLALLRCTLALLLRASRSIAPLDELLQRYPALRLHVDAAATSGLEGLTLELAIEQLDERLWPVDAPASPLARLRDALALDASGIDCFLLCALADDDPALTPLIDALRGHEGRPTRALFAADDNGASQALSRLLAAGCVKEEAAGRWRALSVPPAVWQAVQGQADGPWRLTPPASLPRWTDLILPPGLQAAAQRVQARHAPETLCWALRGGAGSGRRAVAGALARAAGLGLIEPATGDADPVLLAALATLHGAMPLLSLVPGPGEQQSVPPLPGFRGPLAVRLPRHGGLVAEGRTLRWLELPVPEPDERRRHWCRALGRTDVDEALVALRLPRGRIHRLAAADADADMAASVAAEVEAQGRFLLDGLAQRVPPLGAHESLVADDELQQEFDTLLARCRHREALHGLLPAAFGHAGAAGVRALFKGPSGTGKTLAARQLATALARPLYRVDLAATVSKYIGETERNLERVFEAAETLDIVLLLDEGDALMAGRTGVSNATDRYANLETNYLLQRLELYEGILIVTTNAAERIDTAFARRMDVTLDFALPDAQTRHRLWQSHLPAGHALADTSLDELALRCVLSGGQIRNAALQATLLALERSCALSAGELEAALQREYRRAGQVCPSLVLA